MTTSQLFFLLPLAGFVLLVLLAHRGGHRVGGCGDGHAGGHDRGPAGCGHGDHHGDAEAVEAPASGSDGEARR